MLKNSHKFFYLVNTTQTKNIYKISHFDQISSKIYHILKFPLKFNVYTIIVAFKIIRILFKNFISKSIK